MNNKVANVILEIVKEMEDCGGAPADYAKQIKRILQAAGDLDKPAPMPHEGRQEMMEAALKQAGMPGGYHDERGRFHVIDKPAYPRATSIQDDAPGHIGAAESMKECVGGGADGCMFPCPAGVTPGLSTVVNGQWYTYREDGKLHYNEERTKNTIKAIQDNPKLVIEG